MCVELRARRCMRACVHRCALSPLRTRNVHRMRQDEDGNAEAAAGDLDKAEALYHTAAQLAPDDPDVLYQVLVSVTCAAHPSLAAPVVLVSVSLLYFRRFQPRLLSSHARTRGSFAFCCSIFGALACFSFTALFSSHARTSRGNHPVFTGGNRSGMKSTR